MKRHIVPSFPIILSIIFGSCHSGQPAVPELKKDSPVAVLTSSDTISPDRKVVSTKPVAEYRIRTDDPLNTWYFSAAIYETPKTFQYLLKMQFEEIRGVDTLRLPDFGTMPRPEIQKGPDKYSCIIGFRDNENKFREYKKLYVKNGNVMKLVTLNHYSVVTTDK